MTEPTCRSCGVPFANHLRLEEMCERLAEQRAHRFRLESENATLRQRVDELVERCRDYQQQMVATEAELRAVRQSHLADLKEIRCYKGGDRFDNGADFAAIHAFVKGRIEQLTKEFGQ